MLLLDREWQQQQIDQNRKEDDTDSNVRNADCIQNIEDGIHDVTKQCCDGSDQECRTLCKQ